MAARPCAAPQFVEKRVFQQTANFAQNFGFAYIIAKPSRCPGGETGRRKGLKQFWAPRRETPGVNGVKFGETSAHITAVATPS